MGLKSKPEGPSSGKQSNKSNLNKRSGLSDNVDLNRRPKVSEDNASNSQKFYQEQAKRIQKKKQQKPSKAIQLRLWPEELLAAPNSFLRSALFGVVEKGKRTALKEEKLASWPGVELRYTGWRLDQADLDVWTQALHLTKGHLGYRIVLNESKFLRALGRSKGGSNVAWLRSSFIRMRACDIWLDLPGFEYHGGLVDEFARNDDGVWVLQLNPRLAKLFEEGTTYLEVEQRRQLKRSLSKWLQGYICSHKATPRKPHRIGLVKLKMLCGSQRAEMKFFRQDVKRSMTELQGVGVVESWQIVDGQESPVLELIRPRKKRIRRSRIAE